MNNTNYFLEDIAKYGREFDTEVVKGLTVMDIDKMTVQELDALAVNALNGTSLTVYDINSFQARFNCSLFQSVMRVLEIDSNLKIEKGSYVTGRLGIKFDRTDFEYISYNNYYVSEEPEYDEDTKAYVFTAYDKMIEAMIEYNLDVSYPITVRNFIIAICEKLGWDTSGIAETFINSETILYEDVYTDTGFTYRDVLDEIAKITCSFPGFYSDVFQLKYITETGQTINNDYLSQDDLTFSKEYFINSVVFSRAEESDNYYKQDAESIEENGLSEYRLTDLQILGVEDRSKFMDEMYDYLTTLKFWIFNIKSTGIFVFEPADLFTIETDDNSYSVLCLNSEGVVEQGLTEQIYAEEPDESETDYTASTSEEKADRTTRILVNKVEKEIDALVEDMDTYESNYTELKLTVDEISSTVESITEYLRNKTQIHYLYISSDDVATGEGYITSFIVYGGDNFTETTITLCASTKPKGYGDNLDILLETREILTTEDEESLIIGDETYRTPIVEIDLKDVLRSLTIYTEEEETTYYDTLEITQDGTVILTRRIGVDDEGNLYLLEEEVITTYGIEELLYVWSDTAILPTFDGGTYYYIKELDSITYYAEYINNQEFVTRSEMTSTITQTTEKINLEVSKKVDETEIISKINMSSEEIAIQADKISLNGYISNEDSSFVIDEDGNASFSNGSVTLNADGIQLADGTSLVGGKGLYTNLVFTSECKLMGIVGGSLVDPYLEYLTIYAQIPPNFIVESAYITVRHQPIAWSYTNDTSTYSTTTGYTRNAQIYYNAESPYTDLTDMSDYSAIQTMQGTQTTALGSSGKTFSSSATETVTSSDLSEYLTAGDFVEFDIGTTANASSSTTQGYACARCGMAIAQLQVIGYLSVEK